VLHRLGLIGPERYGAHQAGVFRSLRYLDVSRRFRLPDETFECVYASHMLEHLDPGLTEHCLREVHRVLLPSGILRLAVPDLDGVTRRDNDRRWTAGQLGGCARHPAGSLTGA
jgi:predicted SAM-dependent methyltransferase